MRRLALAALLSALAAPAAAQALACGSRSVIAERLKGVYGETRRGYGLQPGRGVIEFYASEGGSWTMILVLPTGAACILAVGEAWAEDLPVRVLDDPA